LIYNSAASSYFPRLLKRLKARNLRSAWAENSSPCFSDWEIIFDWGCVVFEKIAEESVDNDLLKWSVKDYLLKAGICRLCTGDVVDCKRAFEKYVGLSADFGTTLEFELLNDLLAAVENHDQGAFATASKRYHDVSKLDNWKQTLLLKIKESIGGDSGDESDELL